MINSIIRCNNIIFPLEYVELPNIYIAWWQEKRFLCPCLRSGVLVNLISERHKLNAEGKAPLSAGIPWLTLEQSVRCLVEIIFPEKSTTRFRCTV